jgi:TonB family protein
MQKTHYLLLFLFFLWSKNLFAQDSTLQVDEMPYFSGCSKYKSNSKEKRECSTANLAYYLNRNLTYPDSAKEQGIRGIVYVSFVVAPNGFVNDVKLLNDIGAGCGKVAKRVVEAMPAWESALLNDEAIPYELRLPIQFRLDAAQTYSQECRVFWGDLRHDEVEEKKLLVYANQPLLIRDLSGEIMPIINTTMAYENGGNTKKASGKAPFTSGMMKILKKAKTGGRITFVFTLQKKGTFFELYKTYQVK